MDCLIQGNSAKYTTTVSSRGIRHQYESPYSEVPGSSRFPPVASLSAAGYLPDNDVRVFLSDVARGSRKNGKFWIDD